MAPSWRAKASLSSARSMATTSRAPAATAPRSEHRPTPPSPITATEAPAGHPRGVDHRTDAGEHGAAEQGRLVERQLGIDLDQRAARDRGVLGEARDAEMVVDRRAVGPVQPARAREQRAGAVRRRTRLAQAGRPSAHGPQWPQDGTNTQTTWSPRARSSTPGPTSSTMPAASWPSAIGIGRGRSPLITDRSEWHRPAALIRTSTSPGPGGSSSSSSITSGFDVCVGRGAPMALEHGGSDFHAASVSHAAGRGDAVAQLVDQHADVLRSSRSGR